MSEVINFYKLLDFLLSSYIKYKLSIYVYNFIEKHNLYKICFMYVKPYILCYSDGRFPKVIRQMISKIKTIFIFIIVM